MTRNQGTSFGNENESIAREKRHLMQVRSAQMILYMGHRVSLSLLSGSSVLRWGQESQACPGMRK